MYVRALHSYGNQKVRTDALGRHVFELDLHRKLELVVAVSPWTRPRTCDASLPEISAQLESRCVFIYPPQTHPGLHPQVFLIDKGTVGFRAAVCSGMFTPDLLS